MSKSSTMSVAARVQAAAAFSETYKQTQHWSQCDFRFDLLLSFSFRNIFSFVSVFNNFTFSVSFSFTFWVQF